MFTSRLAVPRQIQMKMVVMVPVGFGSEYGRENITGAAVDLPQECLVTESLVTESLVTESLLFINKTNTQPLGGHLWCGSVSSHERQGKL